MWRWSDDNSSDHTRNRVPPRTDFFVTGAAAAASTRVVPNVRGSDTLVVDDHTTFRRRRQRGGCRRNVVVEECNVVVVGRCKVSDKLNVAGAVDLEPPYGLFVRCHPPTIDFVDGVTRLDFVLLGGHPMGDNSLYYHAGPRRRRARFQLQSDRARRECDMKRREHKA